MPPERPERPEHAGRPERAGGPERPERLVLVVGTGTDVGKTWVSARLLTTLHEAGVTVSARKPAQSFDPGDDPAGFDSAVLGAASGEPSEVVCLPHRCYEIPMAPPMAADALGRAGFTVAELVAELVWPEPRIEVGLVETAGGVCSPQADDGDAVTLARALSPDVVLLVADAGLGAINSIRLSIRALVPGAVPSGARPSGARLSDVPLIVLLNRFDPGNDLHRRNRAWLVERDGFTVLVLPGDESALADLARSDGSSRGRVTPL